MQRREEHWAIVDLIGKGGHIWTLPVPERVKSAIDLWVSSARILTGRLFRCVCRVGKTSGDGVSERVVWHVKLCHVCGGELEQIQFLRGHVSVQTTERYLGCKQRIRRPGNDKIDIELQTTSAG